MRKIITNSQQATIDNTENYNMSSKYRQIPTAEVIQRFNQQGFKLESFQEARYRKADKVNKIRHVVQMSIDQDDRVRRQVTIMNASDGSSSLRLHFSYHVFACANGIICADDIIPSTRIRHSTQDPFTIIDNFIETMKSKLDEEKAIRESMYTKILSQYDISEFARKAIAIREKDITRVLDYNAVSIVQRPADLGKTLFAVYQRIQENLLDGNFRKQGIITNDEGKTIEVYKNAKRITSITENARINIALSNLALDYL